MPPQNVGVGHRHRVGAGRSPRGCCLRPWVGRGGGGSSAVVACMAAATMQPRPCGPGGGRRPTGATAVGAHRPWGDVFGATAYLANDSSVAVKPFRKADGGVRLSRVEGVQAVRRSSVLGKGVFLSESTLSAHAGNGLFAGQEFGAGDVITVYDGIVERVGALMCECDSSTLIHCKPVTYYSNDSRTCKLSLHSRSADVVPDPLMCTDTQMTLANRHSLTQRFLRLTLLVPTLSPTAATIPSGSTQAIAFSRIGRTGVAPLAESS